MIPVAAGLAAVLAGAGVAQALVAARFVASFASKPVEHPAERPPVTVLKPLHGDEPLLEAGLESLCLQDYPEWQIVFGVQSEADPAVAVVRRLQARFPKVDIALVVDPALHGVNRKVGNLINMFPAARHNVLVIADSDVHVRPDYLDRLVAALEPADVGLVTTLYAGLPVALTSSSVHNTAAGRPALPSRLGATQITHGFLPGAVLARTIGRQDCLGATMCLRRRDLERIGGFSALADHLADDNVLGRRIAGLGMRVALAQTVPLTTVPEATLKALFRHELRWARTIRALEPAGFAASVLQYPLFWGLLAMLLAGGALWSVGLFLIAWVLRAVAAMGVDAALLPLWSQERGSPASVANDHAALAFSCPVWLLPLRDIFSVAVMLVSYGGRRVDWRGHGLHADTPPPFTRQTNSLRPIKGNKTR
ncbi:MAG TPA: ceramide glucosyltransferase [Acetobacteraceae bacterium]|jgi:ceramide glucosyltransferase|nr:ceramide glucosyltransferase [Acetobacteraceae bacterium]